jgi:hypothetical protein
MNIGIIGSGNIYANMGKIWATSGCDTCGESVRFNMANLPGAY